MASRTNRASDSDHLQAAAAPLHPHRAPWYSYDHGAWLWVPPTAPDPEAGPEVLGANWVEASAELHRLLSRCTWSAQGAPMIVACPVERARVVGQLAGGVAA